MLPRAAAPLLCVTALALAAAALAPSCSSGTPDGGGLGYSRTGLGCYTDSECGLDVCNLPVFPGGACVNRCDDAGSCPSDPDAGFTQVCLGAPDVGACLRGCESDGGCERDGWLCQDGVNGGRVCLPDCRTDAPLCANAGASFECSTLDGICRIPLSADAGLFGECDELDTCAPPADCLALDGQAGDGGFCSVTCSVDGGSDSCPPGGACVVAKALSDGGSELRCGVPCGTEADGGPGCESGLSCQSFPGGALPDGGTIRLTLCAP